MPERKSWIEIIMMPLVVALVGVLGTYFITRQQMESARRASEAQIAAAREAAIADRQIKVLDIFGEKIASKEPNERILALNILLSVEPDLGGKLAKAVGDTEKNPEVKEKAQEVARALAPAKIYIHIRTEADRREALRLAEILQLRGFTVPDIQPNSDVLQASELRYFKRSEMQEASRITKLLKASGLKVGLRYIGGYEKALSERPRQYGLWLTANPPPG